LLVVKYSQQQNPWRYRDPDFCVSWKTDLVVKLMHLLPAFFHQVWQLGCQEDQQLSSPCSSRIELLTKFVNWYLLLQKCPVKIKGSNEQWLADHRACEDGTSTCEAISCFCLFGKQNNLQSPTFLVPTTLKCSLLARIGHPHL